MKKIENVPLDDFLQEIRDALNSHPICRLKVFKTSDDSEIIYGFLIEKDEDFQE